MIALTSSGVVVYCFITMLLKAPPQSFFPKIKEMEMASASHINWSCNDVCVCAREQMSLEGRVCHKACTITLSTWGLEGLQPLHTHTHTHTHTLWTLNVVLHVALNVTGMIRPVEGHCSCNPVSLPANVTAQACLLGGPAAILLISRDACSDGRSSQRSSGQSSWGWGFA